MAHVAQVRRASRISGPFSICWDHSSTPAGVKHQVVGVFDASRQFLVAQTLLALGTERALVIHGYGGYDEAVLHGPVAVIEVVGGAMRAYELFGLRLWSPTGPAAGPRGRSVDENAGILESLLAGGGPPGLRHAVSANCALALRSCGICEDLREGAGRATEALGTGAVGRFVDGLRGTLSEAPRAHVS